MAQTIRIKRSNTTSAPGTLVGGELAYSDQSDKLFIGAPADNAVIAIGGKVFTDMLSHTAGTLTASSAIIVDANSKVDSLKTANLTIGSNSITSGSGDIDLVAAANLDIDASTVDLSTQATEFLIKDDEANGLTIKEGNNKYLTLVTTNSSEKIVLDKQLTIGLDGTAGYTLPTGDGSNGEALITNGSGVLSFGPVSTVLNFADDNGNSSSITQLTQSFTFSEGEGINAVVTNQTLTISAEDATSANKGVASFNSTDFTVSSGAVSINATTIGSTAVNPGETTTALAGLTQLDVDNIRLDANTISTTDSNGNLLLAPQGNGVVNVPSGYKDRSNFSTNSLVSKGYVDAVKQALDIKDSVKVASTANLTYTYDNSAGTLTAGGVGAVTIDGVALDTSGQRVLIKDQSTATQNGIYEVTTVGDGSTALVLTRAADANVAAELTGGTFVFVEEGTQGGNNGFVFTHDGEPTLGSTSLPVAQFSGAGQIITGTGLTKSGNELNIGSSPTVQAQANTIEIRGITTTDVGDLLIGAASDGGYTRLVKPSGNATAHDYILSMNTSGAAQWSNTLDGGTF